MVTSGDNLPENCTPNMVVSKVEGLEAAMSFADGLTPIVLIGVTGAGKSSTSNVLLQDDDDELFEVSAGNKSCTKTLHAASRGGLLVVDTPGLMDTDGESVEFFQQITQFLKKRGGVVFFVHDSDRLKPNILDFLAALVLVGGHSLATNLYVVRTKPSASRAALAKAVGGKIAGESDTQLCDRWLNKQQEVFEDQLYAKLIETGLGEYVGRSRSLLGIGGVMGLSQGGFEAFSSEVFRTTARSFVAKDKIPKDRVRTWDQVLRGFASTLSNVDAKHKAIKQQNEAIQQRSREKKRQRIEAIQQRKAEVETDLAAQHTHHDWHARRIKDLSIAVASTVWVPFFGQISAAGMSAAIAHSQVEVGKTLPKILDLQEQLRALSAARQSAEQMDGEKPDVALEQQAQGVAEQARKLAEQVRQWIQP